MDGSNSLMFSVVVCAHDRRTYLVHALKSVLKQNIPREEYEVILVKNFQDNGIDAFVEENNIESILTEEASLSRKMVEGIKKSRGNYICFLEDDDAFEENKLSRINEVISKYGHLSFYHNSFTIMNEHGESVEATISRSAENIMVFSGKEEIRDGIKSMLKRRADWYGSMMCASRGSLLRYLDRLYQAEGSADKSIFYISLLEGDTVIIDNSRTTKYRFHQSHTIVLTGFPEFYSRKSLFFEKSYKSSVILAEMSRGTFLEENMKCAVLHEEILRAFVNLDERTQIMRYFRRFLYCFTKSRTFSLLFWYSLLIAKKFFKEAALKLYYAIDTSASKKTMR